MNIEVKDNYIVKNLTSFKIGGEVEHIYFPSSIDELTFLLKTLDSPIIMGNWSNVLISSLGISQNVISTHNLSKIEIVENKVSVECGAKGPSVAQKICQKGLSGFEFMIGFPGTIGGNVYMNASAHKQSISDYLVSANVFDTVSKQVVTLSKEELEFSYRASILQKRTFILLSAEFELESKNYEEISARMNENLNFRKNHQPNLSIPNAGSIFRNPEGFSAGALLDDAGAKVFTQGGARVWENHANFIVNPEKSATSSDVLELMFKMYNAVNDKFDIKLQPEVKFIGKATEREEYICSLIYNQ